MINNTLKLEFWRRVILTSFILVVINVHYSVAQFMGIGTNTPRTRLHVSDGPSGNTAPFGPLTVESNMTAFINMLTPNNYESGLLFGKTSNAAHGGIVYNNGFTLDGLQFRTNGNQTRMVITSTGDVGIGTLVPNAALVVRKGTSQGGTAEFWGTSHVSHFNYSVAENTYIRGGKDNSNVILNDIPGGKVGIGTTPGVKLDVLGDGNADLNQTEGDFRVGNGSYRLKLGVALNGAEAGGVGIMQHGQQGGSNNLSIGSQGKYFINVNGNTNSIDLTNLGGGGLRINGNTGANGQVLQSGGNVSAPSWANISTWLFNSIQVMQQSGTTTIGPNSTGSFPSMNYGDFSLVVTTTSKLVLISSSQMEAISCTGCGSSYGYMQTQINVNGSGLNVVWASGSPGNGQTATLTAMGYFVVGPGTYTFNTYGGNYNSGGPSLRFSNVKLMVLLIPQ